MFNQRTTLTSQKVRFQRRRIAKTNAIRNKESVGLIHECTIRETGRQGRLTRVLLMSSIELEAIE